MTHSRWTAVTAVASLAAILTGCVCPCGQKVASLGDQHSVARVVASAGRRPSHATIQRAQNSSARPNETAAGTDHYRYPMAVSGQTSPPADALAAASTAPQTTISRTTISPAPYGSTNFGQAKTNPPTKPRARRRPQTRPLRSMDRLPHRRRRRIRMVARLGPRVSRRLPRRRLVRSTRRQVDTPAAPSLAIIVLCRPSLPNHCRHLPRRSGRAGRT